MILFTTAFITGCAKKEEGINIDYSKPTTEIANYYTDTGFNLIKDTFVDNESIDLALLNLGKPALDIKAKTYNGEDFKLSDLKGKKIMLDLVRADCPTCQAGIPTIDKIIEENEDMVVISVFYRNNKDEIKEYYDNANSNTNKLILTSENFDSKGLISYYNLIAVPSVIFIDEDFRVSYIYSGDFSLSQFEEFKLSAFEEKLYKNLK